MSTPYEPNQTPPYQANPNQPYGAQQPPPYGAPPPYRQDGMSENAAAGVAYLTIIPAIIFLFLAPYNRMSFVRFHAFQCIFLAAASLALNVLHVIPILGTIVAMVLQLAIIVFWFIAIINAFQGKRYHVPILGDLAEKAAAA